MSKDDSPHHFRQAELCIWHGKSKIHRLYDLHATSQGKTIDRGNDGFV
mgnify:CR=1 FL=1